MKKEYHSKIYDKPSTKFRKNFDKLVHSADKVLITSHMGPDDDSISSVLALYTYLVEDMKISKSSVSMMYTGKKEDKWEYFKYFNKVKFVKDIEPHTKKHDLVICLDGGGWKRFSKREKIKEYSGKTICIDHHPTIEGEFDLHLVQGDSPATAEIIYNLFFDKKKKLSKELCETLLMGIIGDTGSFTYIKPEQSQVLNVAARLVKEGDIKIELLKSNYSSMRKEAYLVYKHAVENSQIMSLKGWPDFMVTYISRKFMGKNNLTYIDVDEGAFAFTRYLKGVDGVTWGFVVRPASDEVCGVSYRSIPDSVNVRDMTERMGSGGGHDRAAGGKFQMKDSKRVVRKIINWMESNKPTIV